MATKKTITLELEVEFEEERPGTMEPNLSEITNLFIFTGTRRAPGGLMTTAQIMSSNWADS